MLCTNTIVLRTNFITVYDEVPSVMRTGVVVRKIIGEQGANVDVMTTDGIMSLLSAIVQDHNNVMQYHSGGLAANADVRKINGKRLVRNR